MDSEIKLLIVEHTKIFSDMLRGYFSSLSGYSVRSCAHSKLEALEMIEKHLPDIVILDLVIPHLKGLEVLGRVNDLNLSKRPQIIVMTASGQETLIKKATGLGAICFILKPFDLSMLDMCIRQLTNNTPSYITPAIAPAGVKNKDLELKVTEIVRRMGVPAHIQGYNYLRDALIMATEDAKLMNAVTKEFYPMVAGKYNTTASRVERAIRHAIGLAWDRGNMEMINEYFGCMIDIEKGKPTNSEFIATISDRLRIGDKLA